MATKKLMMVNIHPTSEGSQNQTSALSVPAPSMNSSAAPHKKELTWNNSMVFVRTPIKARMANNKIAKGA